MIINANALNIPLTDKSVHTVVTSPPYYGLRDYNVAGQLGLEPTPDEYIANLVTVFRECKRVLRDDGTLWVNIGDSFAGSGCGTNDYRTEKSRSINKSDVMFSKRPPQQKELPGCKPKDLIGIPWMLAFALRADGWYLRSDIIWAKKNCMPESVKDRPTKSHEYIFLLSKNGQKNLLWRAKDTMEWSYCPDLSETLPHPTEDDPDATTPRWLGYDYYYDHEAIKEPVSSNSEYNRKTKATEPCPYDKALGRKQVLGHGSVGSPDGRNKRDVWFVSTKPYKGAHYATFNPELITPCILAGAPEGGIVFDPFVGSGTTVATAMQLGRRGIGLDLSLKYLVENAKERIDKVRLPLLEYK